MVTNKRELQLEEKAVNRLIKRYTREHNWSMVENLFQTLGSILIAKEHATNGG